MVAQKADISRRYLPSFLEFSFDSCIKIRNLLVELIFTEIDMKKIALFFMIFVFFGVLAAEEAQNEPVTAQPEAKDASEKTQPAEEFKAEEQEKPAEEAPAAEGQEAEVQQPQEEEQVPEIEEKPAEAAPEEAKNETPAQPEEAPAEPAKEEEIQPETAENTACEPVLKDEKPAKFMYQPSAGLGLGASIFSLRVNNDIDFLLKHTKNGTNVYLGLEIDFRYSPYLDDHSVYEIPLQMNMLFDFPVVHRNISRLSLWFSAGVDLAIGYLFYYDYDDDEWDDRKDRDSMFKVMAAWGFGVTMLFRNEVTLKLGFDSFYGKYPDLVCVAGYRF